jgi:2-iminobutanoate/2-iminopropanoate deaminase
MRPRSVHSDDAPAAIGPYSQAIRAGDLLFCSGQIGLDPTSGKLVSDDVVEQAGQVMKNLKAVLAAAGADLTRVAKTTIYLTDLGNFGKVNEVYGSFFDSDPPARATVQVSALPLGARVEVEAVAVLG